MTAEISDPVSIDPMLEELFPGITQLAATAVYLEDVTTYVDVATQVFEKVVTESKHFLSKQNPVREKKSRKWTKEQDDLVLNAYKLHGPKWAVIANLYFDDKIIGNSIRQRYMYKLDPKINRSPWTEEEIRTLCESVKIFKGNKRWEQISKEKYKGHRTGRDCKQLWNSLMKRSAQNKSESY